MFQSMHNQPPVSSNIQGRNVANLYVRNHTRVIRLEQRSILHTGLQLRWLINSLPYPTGSATTLPGLCVDIYQLAFTRYLQ